MNMRNLLIRLENNIRSNNQLDPTRHLFLEINKLKEEIKLQHYLLTTESNKIIELIEQNQLLQHQIQNINETVFSLIKEL
jgi:hypothetical protein